MSRAVWSTIEAALRDRPANSALDEALADPELSPWALCTLVALARHRVRQAWVGEIVRTRLDGDPRAIARLGGAGHPEQRAQLGDVPGLPGWSYFFHGIGCCLSNADSGEEIDVDFGDDGRTDIVNAYFFARYLESLRHPEPVEARLIALHPSFRTVAASMVELVERGFVDEGRTVLSQDTLAHEHLLHAVADRFVAAVGLPGEAMLARRRTWLLARDRASGAGDTLGAFAETSPPDLATHLTAALEELPFNARTSTAIELIDRQNDPSYCPAVWRLLGRLDPAGPIPQPHLWSCCSKLLLRHAYSVEGVIATLADARGTATGEAALLALEFAPPLGRPLLRKALRSDVPHARGVAAATLAVIEQAWALEELHALLSESTDDGFTAECRAALRSIGDPEGACSAWELAHGAAPPTERSMTIDQLVSLGTEERVEGEIERLRERVRRLTRTRPS